MIGSEIKQRKTNWIGLRIASSGGELAECLRLANKLADLRRDEVQTVAYVPMETSGGAGLAALACDQLVMHPEARIVGAEAGAFDEAELADAMQTIRDPLSNSAGRSWSLLGAVLDPAIEVFAYRNKQTGETGYFSEEEAAAQPDADHWLKGEVIKPAGKPLVLTSEQAAEMGLAWQLVDNFDEFKLLYGFEHDPREARPNWALDLVEALSSPALAALLLVIGFVGIYIELHSPGIGAGAFVAALAFLLYFWSNYLGGSAGWLEAVLFVAGLCFLAMELFVLPGFGVFGLGGGLMMIAALVLATQTELIPKTESQVAEMRRSLTIVVAAAVATITIAIALRRYLPQAPMLRTLLLNPAPEQELAELEYRESLADFSYLVGQRGVARTNLMPAGKAEFDGRLVDVIAEGLPIDRGQSVVVTRARGNRVVVRPAGVS
jgi:membrane-bound ClpP family serine protease